MGGYGSGRWGWRNKKRTVEEMWTLDIFRLFQRKALVPGAWTRGVWQWLRAGEQVASIGYEGRMDLDQPYVRLHYTSNGEPVDYRVPLVTTMPHFGGVRWWFACPGQSCGRRAGKLYGGKYYLCRHCHDLTYESAQEAHKHDAALAMIGRDFGLSGREVARLFKREGGL